MCKDKPREECGIFGGYRKNGAIAPLIKEGLFTLQHRGQEAAGICTGDDAQMLVKANGLVLDALPDDKIAQLQGFFGIGHVRYSTQGGSNPQNAQPLHICYMGEDVSIAHNGNIKNAESYRKKLCLEGEVFLTTSDSEIILKRLCQKLKKKPSTWRADEIGKILNEDFPDGSYSLLIFIKNKIFAIKDSKGYRPLSVCVCDEGFFASSEDIAFCNFTNKTITEINAGQYAEITNNGIKTASYIDIPEELCKRCTFEHIYFANPASVVFKKKVYDTRLELGKLLAKEDNVSADVVIPVMDSGFISALGYCFESKIPLEMGLIRNKYVGRSFIEPDKKERIKKVREKLIPIKSVIENRDIILVDDSLVRGITAREIIAMLRRCNCGKIHLRIASPVIQNTCFWGVDIPTKDELVFSGDAASFSGDELIRNETNADSVRFLSFESLTKCFSDKGWCYNCFLK